MGDYHARIVLIILYLCPIHYRRDRIPAITFAEVSHEATPWPRASLSSKRDVAVEFDFDFESSDLEGHLGGRGFCSCNSVRRGGLGDRVFNLAFGGDADPFSKF